MKKIREYYICDRCKKEIDEDKINKAYYTGWYYQLCDDCFKKYKEFKDLIEKLKKKWEKLEQEYQFGKYLPEDLESKGE